MWRGRATDPRWVRPALIGLLVATGVLYLWDLSASGWANSFYSAAAQAGSESWKAFFFGSSDAANSITVDKPPAALWVMSLSVRIFGLSSWSLLVPQALMGVATVALLYATVRRSVSSAGAGLLAGAVLALTPVAALMFRFNNPDALLTLLLVGSVAATLRAVEATRAERALGRTSSAAVRWLALAGALVGLAFLTKMLQAFLVLPAIGVMYLWAADTTLLRRVKHLVVAGCAMLIAAGWWIAIVSLWPAASRPYIGGSQGNSILELTLGYNGFGRLTGDETGSVGGQGGWGETGLLRLFDSEIGGQIGWLIPAALVLGIAAGWQLRRSPRTDLTRAALVGWGLWLVVTALTFSFMAGIFHAYYTVALAPAVAAVVAIAATVLWRQRDNHLVALSLAAAASITSVLGFTLLDRAGDYVPWLKWVVLVGGLAAALLLGAVRYLPLRVAAAVAAVAMATALAGPTAYSLSTVGTAHTGSIPTAGPSTASGGPGGMPGGMPGGTAGALPGVMPGGATAGTPGGMPGNFAPPGGTAAGTPGGGSFTGGQAGGGQAGGLLEASTPSAAITALLEADADDYTWVAATIGSNNASGYQLASEEPVMAIGGFNGSDPSPTLAEFKQLVAQGEIHYFLGGSTGMMGADSGSSSQIGTWVSENFTSQTVDGLTVYDLTQSGGVGG